MRNCYLNYNEKNTGRSLLRAFSLVEMLMALLVASLILAALAPVMTRKLNNNLNVSLFNEGKVIEPCAFVNDVLDIDSDRECIVPEDAEIASAIIVSGGGGGGGATDGVKDNDIHISESDRGREGATSIYTTAIPGSNSALNYSHNFTITKEMSDFEVDILSGGEGGGTGNSNGGGHPASQADCGNWAIYIAPEYNGTNGHGTCVSKYNPGENRAGSPDIPTSGTNKVDLIPTGTTCTTASSGNCCWYGNNDSNYPTTNGYDTTNGTYSGGFRTVCQWEASRDICNAWKPTANGSNGRLPEENEIKGWSANLSQVSATKGVNGLQLCASDKISTGSSFCGGEDKKACPDAGAFGACYPAFIWSGTETAKANSYPAYNIYKGQLGMFQGNCGPCINTYAFTARCVIDNISEFTSRIGAGGMGGQYAKVKIPNEILKKAFELTYDEATDTYKEDPVDTLRLNIYGGAGGKAGTVDRGPYAGGMAYVNIYKNNKAVFTVGIYGGGKTSDSDPYNNNGNAIANRNGIPYDVATSSGSGNLVYKNNYSNTKEFRKTVFGNKYPYFASEGVLVDFKISKAGNTVVSSSGAETENDTPGASGAGYWGNIYGTRGNTPATSHPGSGGKGGYCKQGVTRLEPICTDPTNGSAGAARFTYKRNYPGIGGNGGNSGSILHIKNIKVNKGDIIKVHVGAPGSGGVANSDGHNGGNSWVEINGKKYEAVGGKGGKTGTAANPPATAETDKFAKPGAIQTVGEGDIITDETKSNLNSLGKNNYEIFPNPSDNDEKLLSQGKQAQSSPYDTTVYKAAGGNGGVNSKTALLAGLRGIPCGAFSTTSIKISNKEYKCGSKELPTPNYTLTPLYRTLNENDMKIKASNYINNYAPGGTGGGGAGWSNDYKTGSEAKTGQGQDGMGGYVLIYFE